MIQETDYTALLQTIERMQKELQDLQREVVQLRILQSGKRGNKQRSFKSLYGIFPPGNTTMEDFREARRGGTPRSLRNL